MVDTNSECFQATLNFIKQAEIAHSMAEIRLPPVEVINTDEPETEIWERIGYFESESFVNNFRNARINDEILKSRCEQLRIAKEKHNAISSNPQLEMLQQISAMDVKIAREIATTARQARFLCKCKTNANDF